MHLTNVWMGENPLLAARSERRRYRHEQLVRAINLSIMKIVLKRVLFPPDETCEPFITSFEPKGFI